MIALVSFNSPDRSRSSALWVTPATLEALLDAHLLLNRGPIELIFHEVIRV